MPFIKKIAGPIIKVLHKLWELKQNKDAWFGKPMSESFKKNDDVAIDNLKIKAENALSGKGVKRRRSMKKIIILKKRNNKRKK